MSAPEPLERNKLLHTSTDLPVGREEANPVRSAKGAYYLVQ